ncbi:DNA repair protein XRCC2-like [Cimex lectularius]|uniref:RecA family profile 1 domain-containing protein n=1 Tax=Cimex lectularius TaxID=79782 RepID=A0A8I6TDX0_CIMLE|nr:DNA repair protein XRCC2-like [Cimex lectularius]
MEGGCRQETALQLLSRQQTRPSIKGLNTRIFEDGPKSREVVEINGEAGSGKSLLLLEFVKQCILPSGQDCRGLQADVLYLNTDLQFNLNNLIRLLKCSTNCEKTIEQSLKRIHVINIFDSATLTTTILYLKKLLCINSDISLILIDSISAFYWQDTLEGGIKKMDSYISSIVLQLHQSIGLFDVNVMYTRPEYFKTKNNKVECSSIYDLSGINTIIELKTVNGLNYMQVRTNSNNIMCNYTITDKGFEFVT